MFRKWVLPAACAALLGGCVSYGYNDGGYYGQPSVRYYGGASYGYPYGGYGPYSRYYGGRYGYGYGDPYGYGYGGYSRYPYYPYYPNYPRRRGGHDRDDHDHGNNPRGGNPPWRRAPLSGEGGGLLREAIRRQHEQPVSQPQLPGRTPTLRDRYQPRPPTRAQIHAAPAMERATPSRRESAPAARNMRERDVSREQEP